MKILLIFTAFVITFFTFNPSATASDYQYKVLDPKYNPAAEKLIENSKMQNTASLTLEKTKKFDFARFLAILAVVSFPMFIISLAIKTFKQVTDCTYGKPEESELDALAAETAQKEIQKDFELKSEEKQVIGNVKIPVETTAPVTDSIFKTQKQAVNNSTQVDSNAIQKEIFEMFKAQTQLGKLVTSPIENKNPMLLNTLRLTSNKGICLVEYNKKYSLIGYINDNIFLLDEPEKINNTEIRSRLSERVDNKDRYFVRLGNTYKALVEVSDSDMNLLIEL